MTFDTDLYTELNREPAENHVKKAHLTGDEWRALKESIRKLKEGWVRHANVARDIRPARSHSGYRLLSIRPGTAKKVMCLVIDLETPYRIDAFSYTAVEMLIKSDIPKLCEELGYEEIRLYAENITPTEDKLTMVQVSASVKQEYYHIRGYSKKAPRISFFEKAEASDEKEK